jgi:protein TonB
MPPSPPPVAVPPPISPATPPPLPVPPVVKPDDFVVPPPKPVLLTPPAPTVTAPAPATPRIVKQPVKSSMVHHRQASSQSQGEIQAQPDELQNQPPEYPEESRAAGEQGIVMLRVQVTAGGKPASVSILRSSGYFHLDQAARRAVEHWRFHPGLIAGIPVASEADVPVRFTLQ